MWCFYLFLDFDEQKEIINGNLTRRKGELDREFETCSQLIAQAYDKYVFLLKPMTSMVFFAQAYDKYVFLFAQAYDKYVVFFCSSLWQVWFFLLQVYDKYVFFLLKPMTSMFLFLFFFYIYVAYVLMKV